MIDRISTVAANVAAALVFPWTALFVVYIILRKTGLAAWPFVEEYTGYWMAFVTSLALAYTLRSGEHIRITIVTDRLPSRVNHILDVLATLLALAVIGVFTQHGMKHTALAFTMDLHYSAASQALLWPFYLCMPLGFALLGLALLLHLYHSVLAVIRK